LLKRQIAQRELQTTIGAHFEECDEDQLLRRAAELAERHLHVPCMLLLYEKMARYDELATVLGELDQVEQLLSLCRRLGTSHPQFWLEALRLFSRLLSHERVPEKDTDHTDTVFGTRGELSQLLLEAAAALRESRALSAEQILSEISSNATGTELPIIYDDVRSFFEQEVRTFGALAGSVRQQQQEVRTEIVTATGALIREANQTVVLSSKRCSLCHLELDVPLVHFACKHSFHRACATPAPTSAQLGNTTKLSQQPSSSAVSCAVCRATAQQSELLSTGALGESITDDAAGSNERIAQLMADLELHSSQQ